MNKKVIIYSTPSCVYCNMAKAFFKDNAVKYDDRNVVTDEKSRDEMIQKSGQIGVPVIDIEGEIIIGFDKPAIVSLLGLKK